MTTDHHGEGGDDAPYLTNEQHEFVDNIIDALHERGHASGTGPAGAGKTRCAAEVVRRLGLRPFAFSHAFAELRARQAPGRQQGTYIAAAFVRRAADNMTRRGTPARTIHSVAYSPLLNMPTAILNELTQLSERLEYLEAVVSQQSGGKATPEQATEMRALTTAIENLTEPDFSFSSVFLQSTNLLLVDEASMVPKAMRDQLIAAGTEVVFLGDHGQNRCIDSEPWFLPGVADATLKTVMRQNADSGVLRAAMYIRKGNALKPKDKPMSTGGMTIHRQGLWQTWLRQNIDVVDVGWIVSDTNKLRKEINKFVRKVRGRRSWLPERGDRLVATSNSARAANGDLLTVLSVSGYDENLHVVWLSCVGASGVILQNIPVHPKSLADLYDVVPRGASRPYSWNRERAGLEGRGAILGVEYGPTLTCHKAQGGENERVVVIPSDWCGGDSDGDRRRWLYTALTRATQTCDLFFHGIGEGRSLDEPDGPGVTRRVLQEHPM